MILYAFKPTEEETEPPWPGGSRRTWRWVFEVDASKRGLSIGLTEQVKFIDKENAWGTGNGYYDASLTPHWRIGERHGYYDGPNCGMSFGFLHVSWSAGWCLKCMPEER